ncbi:MAG: exodeoxyribonuclease V subunit gamma [Cardiobacteriaceae bacterium]|nr:exodeoxyribonuclease V subunit gamma [Cardiobacteriaceae bacterium]
MVNLNEEQQRAVFHHSQAVRVIAGAGSGKTRVLVERIRYLLENNLSPHAILTLTFTNKAAREIKERLQSALPTLNLSQLWAGTFHSICHKILRRFAPRLGLSEQFSILDSDEQIRIIKQLLKDHEIDPNLLEPKQAQHYFHQMKRKGYRATAVPQQEYIYRSDEQRLYLAYEALCRQENWLDFDDLLLFTLELLESQPDVRQFYQKRFVHLLVDEFQDTSPLEFRFLQQLINPEQTHIFVVGDDDQSIYGFRGAEISNILELHHHFPQLVTLRLEQNYRSTQTILQAANALIAHNTERLGKSLYSHGNQGDKIDIYPAFSEYDEVNYVINHITTRKQAGSRWADHAILYRTNAHSRLFEQTLTRQGIPYQIYGGHRFFDRSEIKSALAYLRLMFYPLDNKALLRVINLPARGIGEKTQSALNQIAQQHFCSLWEILKQPPLLAQHFKGKTLKALLDFHHLIHHLHQLSQELKHLQEALYHAVHDSGLYALYDQDPSEEAQSRRDNLAQLLMVEPEEEQNDLSLSEQVLYLLSEASLTSNQEHQAQDAVQLMTLHSSKGLEFPYVYLIGMEEGIFPNHRSLASRKALEEERRLAYVGMTRAQSALCLSCATVRSLYGKPEDYRPSRFLYEIPKALCRHIRPLPSAPQSLTREALDLSTPKPRQPSERTFYRSRPSTENKASSSDSSSSKSYRLGQSVVHPKHGLGVIEGITLEPQGVALTVQFSHTRLTYPAKEHDAP